MSLSVTMAASLSGDYTKTKGIGLATFSLQNHPMLGSLRLQLTDGTGSGQADLAYMSGLATDIGSGIATPRTIAATSNDDLDLNNLLPDALGDTLSLAKLKMLVIYADPANVADLVIGNGTNPFIGWFGGSTQTFKLPAGGLEVKVAPLVGWTVTPGTGDILRINNPGASSAAYHIFLAGTSV